VFCRSSFVLSLLVIVLSVLLFTASDYTFDVFKHFLHVLQMVEYHPGIDIVTVGYITLISCLCL